MKVTLIHAYSTTNSGDGLLVTEAVDIVREAYPDAEFTLVAIDPDSFEVAHFASVLHPLTGRPGSIGSIATLARGALAFVLRRRTPGYQRAVQEADLVVAVGGGYLRGKSPVEAVKMVLAHVTQMPVGSDRVPFVYLPQSIGPLNVGTLPIVARRLAHASSVVVRDDRSVRDLSRLDNVRRAPDMALLGLPTEWDPSTTVPAGRVDPSGSWRVSWRPRGPGRRSTETGSPPSPPPAVSSFSPRRPPVATTTRSSTDRSGCPVRSAHSATSSAPARPPGPTSLSRSDCTDHFRPSGAAYPAST